MTNRIGRASMILASGTVVSRVLGFISAIILARTLGLFGSGADAFALANQLPNNVYVIVAGGVLSSVLVPQIVKAHLHDDGGVRFINRLLTLAFSAVALVTIVAVVSAPLLVQLYTNQSETGSWAGFGAANVQLATAFAWWCLPQVFFYAAYSVVGEVLNARGVFGPFTWTPALNNVVAIAGMMWFANIFTGDVHRATDWNSTEIAVLAGTATLGVVVQAGALSFSTPRGYSLSTRFSLPWCRSWGNHQIDGMDIWDGARYPNCRNCAKQHCVSRNVYQ